MNPANNYPPRNVNPVFLVRAGHPVYPPRNFQPNFQPNYSPQNFSPRANHQNSPVRFQNDTMYFQPRKNPDFFSKPRMICDCKLEFLDAGAYAKHMKNTHPDKKMTWNKQKWNICFEFDSVVMIRNSFNKSGTDFVPLKRKLCIYFMEFIVLRPWNANSFPLYFSFFKYISSNFSFF